MATLVALSAILALSAPASAAELAISASPTSVIEGDSTEISVSGSADSPGRIEIHDEWSGCGFSALLEEHIPAGGFARAVTWRPRGKGAVGVCAILTSEGGDDRREASATVQVSPVPAQISLRLAPVAWRGALRRVDFVGWVGRPLKISAILRGPREPRGCPVSPTIFDGPDLLSVAVPAGRFRLSAALSLDLLGRYRICSYAHLPQGIGEVRAAAQAVVEVTGRCTSAERGVRRAMRLLTRAGSRGSRQQGRRALARARSRRAAACTSV